jgi:hypothetical protein
MPDGVTMNDVGDIVLERVEQLRALAEPERLAVFTRLQRSGPATAGGLSAELGYDVSDPLEQLAAAGLVTSTGDEWLAHGRGLLLQLPEGDPEAARAARDLSSVMLVAVEHLPRQWVEQTEPQLDDAWAGAAGLFNAGVVLTAEELNHVQEELERLLLPYLNRSEAGRPASARRVRVLAYFLPEAAPDAGKGSGRCLSLPVRAHERGCLT